MQTLIIFNTIIRTGPRTTHVFRAGDLVPAGTILVTPDIYIDKYINVNSKLKLENIIKLKHYMHKWSEHLANQVGYCETTFLALPRIAYIIFNRVVAGKTTILRQKSQLSHYYYRIATKLVKTHHYLLL